MMAVTDTHALMWYAQKHRRLGRRARKVFAEAEAGRVGIYVPTMVLVELFEAAYRGELELPDGIETWAADLWAAGAFFPTDLTPPVVYRAESLRDIPERGDRLIAATAAQLGCPLLTRDEAIGAAAGVEVIWD